MTHIIINSGRNLHEKLKCDTLFQHELVLKRIKNYLAYYITYFKLVNALPEEENYGDFTLRIVLLANGKTFTEQNPDELQKRFRVWDNTTVLSWRFVTMAEPVISIAISAKRKLTSLTS